jgi:CheY-like chemotaxis protein
MDGDSIVQFIAVDPAEVRALPMYDERVPIGVGTWSDIARALDTVDRRLAEEESQQDRGVLEQRTKLTESLVETLLQEAAAHGARSVEIVFSDERSRYQFTTRDGRCGVGNIRRDVVADITAFLGRFQGACYISSKRGEVLVRSLGATGNVKLSWGERDLSNHEPARPDSVDSCELQGPQETGPDVPELSVPIPANAPDERASLVEERGMTSESACVPILVVDDNPMFCRVLERLLERDGFEPHFAANGGAAWEWLSRATAFQPRAIVCDLHMPIMNGQELLDKVRSEQRLSAVPFIMLTSDDDVNAELSLLARGADAFVSKSKDPRVLCAQIRRLSQRAALQEAA